MKIPATHVKLGAGLAALVGAGVWLGASPSNAKATALLEKIERSRSELHHSQATARDIRTMASTLHQARDFALASTKPLAASDETSLLVHELSSFLQTLEIGKHELRQERARIEEGVRVTPLTLSMESGYPAVLAVLDRIYSLDRLLRVTRLTIDPPRGSGPGAPTLVVEIVIEAMSTESPAPSPMATVTEGASR